MPSLVTQDADTIGAASDTDSGFFNDLFEITSSAMGADDDGTVSSLSYSLSVTTAATGLTSDGLAITVAMDGNDVVGSTVNGAIFRVHVDAATGEVTLTQYAEIDHLPETVDATNDNSNIGLAAGNVVLTASASITDGDNDTDSDSQSLDISGAFSFDDDVPSIDPVNMVIRKEDGVSGTATLNLIPGADDAASIVLSIAGLNDGDQIDGITSGGEPVLYRAVGSGFEGYTDIDGVEAVIFTVIPDLATGTYTVEIIGMLDGAGGATIFDLSNGISGGNTDDFFLLAPDVNFDDSTVITVDNGGTNDDLFAGVDPNTGLANPDGLVIHASAYNNNGTVSTADDASLTVNSSAFSLAVGAGQSIGVNDVLVLEFTQASSWQYDKSGGNSGMYDAAGNTVYELIDNLRFDLFDFSAGEVIEFTLLGHNPDGTTYVVDSGTITATAGFAALSGSTGMSVELLQGMTSGTVIDGLEFNFDGGSLSGSYDTIEFSALNSGDDFKVGEIAIVQIDEGSDQFFDVTATVTDGDGDVATNTFTVTLDGNDGLIGGDGDDAIIGGAGSDSMTGGLGSDTFAWTLADADPSTPPTDTITDFNVAPAASGGDVLDLSDLLEGASPISDPLGDYLDISFNGGNTTIAVHSGGTGMPVDQIIVLQGVDLTVGGTLNETQIISNLLSANKLIVD